MNKFLIGFGFINTTANASFFVYYDGKIFIYFLVYVDDLIATGSYEKIVNCFLTKSVEKFSLKDLSDLNFFLGVEVIKLSRGLFLNQRKYTRDIFKRFDMSDAKPTSTSMASTTKLKANDG